jgi:hypothetical protein
LKERHASRPSQSRRGGSTLYDRSLRPGTVPSGAAGVFARRDGAPGHSTQYYDDGYRVSWGTDGERDHAPHWTNQTVGKKHPDRHIAPPDTR